MSDHRGIQRCSLVQTLSTEDMTKTMVSRHDVVPWTNSVIWPLINHKQYISLTLMHAMQLDDGKGDGGEDFSVVDIKGMGKMRVGINVKVSMVHVYMSIMVLSEGP